MLTGKYRLVNQYSTKLRVFFCCGVLFSTLANIPPNWIFAFKNHGVLGKTNANARILFAAFHHFFENFSHKKRPKESHNFFT